MTYIRPDERYPINWNRIRFAVFKRDGFRCVLCGSRNNLVCHHIDSVSHSQNHSLKNLVTICKDCHYLIHKKGMYWLNDVLRRYIEWIYGL